MRKEYIEKLLVLTPHEQERFEKNEIITNDKGIEKKEKYFYDPNKNICYVLHQRFSRNLLHGHDFVEMMYVVNGNITHVIDGQEICLGEGDVLIMNKYVKHEVKTCYKNDIGLNFLFGPDFFDEVIKLSSNCRNKYILHFLINILKDDKRPYYMTFETKGNVAVENLFEILSLPYIVNGYKVNDVQILTALIFKYLADEYNITQNKYVGDVMDEYIISYINNNYRFATLEELSRQLLKPATTVSRYIKKMSGCNFNELVKRKRFHKAASLLEKTDMSILDIMHAVGYENSSYFYNEFRKRYSLTPAEYRNKNRIG